MEWINQNLINWQNQVRLYIKHIHTTEDFSEGKKKIMLQNAVLGIYKLRHVNKTADFIPTSSGNPMGYDKYCRLMLAAEVSDDEQCKPKKTKRQEFYHASHTNDDIQGVEEYPYDIEYPASSLQAIATNRNRPPMRSNAAKFSMSAEKWHNLDDKSKDIWDRLYEKAK
jgi:hypothetical protein